MCYFILWRGLTCHKHTLKMGGKQSVENGGVFGLDFEADNTLALSDRIFCRPAIQESRRSAATAICEGFNVNSAVHMM